MDIYKPNENQDYYGYVYLTVDQKHNKKYVGQKKGKVEKSKKYFGSGSHIQRIIKYRGTYFLKKTILGICDNANELTECETECKLLFNTIDNLYGYNILTEDMNMRDVSEKRRKEMNQRLSESHKGYKVKEEVKNKISKSSKGKKKSPRTKEHARKIIESRGKIIPGNYIIPPPKKELEEKIKLGMNLTKLNKFYNCNVVKSWLIKYDIYHVYLNNNIKKKDRIDYFTLKEKIEQNYSFNQIAKYFNVSTPLIKTAIIKFNLKEEYKKREKKLNKGYYKIFIVLTPESKMLYIYGVITKFCKQNNLSYYKMKEVSKGRLIHHKGWKCIDLSKQVKTIKTLHRWY